MDKSESPNFIKSLRKAWMWAANLGVQQASYDERPRVQRLNNALLGYMVSGHIYTLIYLCLGAWKLLALQISMSWMAPLTLWLNHRGRYRQARIFQSTSFAIAIAFIVCVLGEETYIALLFFPAISSAFVNFESHEKTDLKISLSVAAAITAASQAYAHYNDAWIVIDIKWLPLIRVGCWFGAVGIFISQIYMFFKSVDESKKALMVSHSHLRDMLASVDDGFYYVDREWTLLYYNAKADGFLRSMGVTDAKGRKFWGLIESEDQQSWVPGVKNAMDTLTIYREEYYDSLQDTWVEVVAYPSINGMSVTFRMINERKKSEIALREGEQLQRAIFDHAATGLAITTVQGQFERVNSEFCRILGYEESELLGRFAVDITVKEEQNRTAEDVRRIIDGEVQGFTRQKKYVHKTGRSVPVNLQVRTMRDENGRPKFNVVSVQDLTDAKQSEQKLVQASKMSSLGEMAGSIAHEINSPMAVIQLCAEQLEDSETVDLLSAEEISEMGQRISETVTRISKIIKGLKTFSRNAERDEMEFASVQSLIDETLELCREKFKQKGIELRVGDVSKVETLCRPTEICQVLLNLLSNAFDAVDCLPLRERWVEVSALHFGANVSITVVDSGLGIPKEIVKRMHEPFFTTKGTGKGTGLGLSISKGIVEAHGGVLFLDEESAHTKFVIELKASEHRVVEPSTVESQTLKAVSGGN